MSQPMELEVTDGVANLRLAGGPMDLPWTQELKRIAGKLATTDGLRVVRISSTGRFFCPGGDVAWMQAQPDMGAAIHELASTLHAGLLGLAALDAPVVAEVGGVAAGAGMSFVLGCDLAFAAESASFTMAYTGVGLSPDGGSSWLLPRLVGRRQAMAIMLANPKLSAAEAADLGVVTAAVPDDELTAFVDDAVAKLADGPTASYGAIKRLLAVSSQNGFEEQLALEADEISAAAGSPTGAEGVAAFLERRKPNFP